MFFVEISLSDWAHHFIMQALSLSKSNARHHVRPAASKHMPGIIWESTYSIIISSSVTNVVALLLSDFTTGAGSRFCPRRCCFRSFRTATW